MILKSSFPALTSRDVYKRQIKGNKKIIGIDLTGSEDKESGWAYMVANRVNCRRIRSDSELIESIKQYNPDIVSIDSPLAYPKGRCCARKECECSKYGIMRSSERMLRHFGITVYPCLIAVSYTHLDVYKRQYHVLRL